VARAHRLVLRDPRVIGSVQSRATLGAAAVTSVPGSDQLNDTVW
jgi:hypothetical protein